MINGRRLGMCGMIIAFGACRTASSGTLTAPPCTDRAVIFASGDTVHDVHAPLPTHIFLPELPSATGTAVVRLLVKPDGTVLADSSRVIQTNNAEWGRAALAAAVQTTFTPATLDGCAVYYWYEMTTSNRKT